jgi:nucleotide-binding universal stress UspA family protein
MEHSEQHEVVIGDSASAPIFARIVVGVDGTEPGFEACRQAALFAEEGAAIEAVAVVHLADAVWTGGNAPRFRDELECEAEAALDNAIAILGDNARRRFVNGYVVAALLREVDAARATALVVGSHGHRRAFEILVGGVAGELLHSAPCAVLVARPPADPAAFPSTVVVGCDGSRASDEALAAAGRLAARFTVPLSVVTALGGKGVDLERVQRVAPRALRLDGRPVDALVHAGREGALLVVGSRGLHGLRALGSVSERVAHKAACSVLVVRSV